MIFHVLYNIMFTILLRVEYIIMYSIYNIFIILMYFIDNRSKAYGFYKTVRDNVSFLLLNTIITCSECFFGLFQIFFFKVQFLLIF